MSQGLTTILTSAGALSVAQSAGQGLPLVLLHGNSQSKDVFAKQMRSPLASSYRMIAIDLPGHGRSAPARDPFVSYSLPGYAAAVLEVLEALEVDRATFLGWSLGGHVAYEIGSSWSGTLGVMTSGAPPLRPTPQGVVEGFNPTPALPFVGKQVLEEEEAALFASVMFGDPAPDFALRDIRRTDGRARRLMFESVFAGNAADERAFVDAGRVPVAIVDGEHEPFANENYMATLDTASLWEGRRHRISGAGHAPFWQSPREFNSILLRFMRDIARRSVSTTDIRATVSEVTPRPAAAGR